MARKNWGDARAEVLALMPEINKLVSAGIKRIKIYELMRAEHGLSCNLRTFNRWVVRHNADLLTETAAPAPAPAPSAPAIPVDPPQPESGIKKPLRTAVPPRRNHRDDRENTASDGPIVVRTDIPQFRLHDD